MRIRDRKVIYILNVENMSYLTTPTKCGGIKRLRKQKPSTSKKKKLDSGISDSVPTNESPSTDNEEEDEEEGGDDIDWKKLEQVLEESAQKANLTAVNVKSILHVRVLNIIKNR